VFILKELSTQRVRASAIQLQPHPPPQQLPPLPEKPPEDLAAAPLLDPFAELKTESCSAFFFPAHFGQAISCVLFSTIFSKCAWQSSQMYS
jgi:hypothetical protein